ncbi:MAG TPA: DUF58 domain-containing protein [Nocardioidaceae bacterium]|nr:DUF58 domain-containing protein [Nocardioidaceae bacterium]
MSGLPATARRSSPTPSPKPSSWKPTPAHVRACLLAVGLPLVSLLLHRPDLAVIGTPLLVVALWSALTRPREDPVLSAPRALAPVREGASVRWTARLSPVPGMTQGALVFERSGHLQLRPAGGAVVVAIDPTAAAPVLLSVGVRSTRWGVRPVGRAFASATSSWGAFRWKRVELAARPLTTLPLPALFDAAAPAPRPQGLVGLNRSPRPGDGTEFDTIRPYQQGDRLRRVNWPVSLRTSVLHVTSTYADQDSAVMLLVDASNDLGASGGIDGAASSLDQTVRAAGAVAEHFLRHGDRVGMRVFGPADGVRVMPAAGLAHLRKLLQLLAETKVASRESAEPGTFRVGIGAGTLVLMFSACISASALAQTVMLARRGLTTVVVDTLPAHLELEGDPLGLVEVAWRIRRLERSIQMRRVTSVGIPIVAWRGPGSLDQVLRDLARRSTAPRPVHA